jgi:two-component system response regulator YesN
MIVDDESMERDGLEYLLKKHSFDFRIEKACNGQDAYERLQKQPADVLITDIRMPFMDGLALSEKAKELYPDLIVLISSAYDDFEYMHRAIKVKVEDYILKPVVVSAFVRIVKSIQSSLESRSRLEERRRETVDFGESSDYRKEKLFKQVEEEASASHFGTDVASEKRAIAEAVALIESHYREDIGLEWVAKQIYLSPGYLSGLFKKETGKSIIQYITLCRLESAKKLLTETNMKIVDVCQEVGYNNASYFCLLFRKYFGVTPNHMKEQRGGA